MSGGAHMRGAAPLQLRRQQAVQGEAGQAEGAGDAGQERRHHLPHRDGLQLRDAGGGDRRAALSPPPHRLPGPQHVVAAAPAAEEPLQPSDGPAGDQGAAAELVVAAAGRRHQQQQREQVPAHPGQRPRGSGKLPAADGEEPRGNAAAADEGRTDEGSAHEGGFPSAETPPLPAATAAPADEGRYFPGSHEGAAAGAGGFPVIESWVAAAAHPAGGAGPEDAPRQPREPAVGFVRLRGTPSNRTPLFSLKQAVGFQTWGITFLC